MTRSDGEHRRPAALDRATIRRTRVHAPEVRLQVRIGPELPEERRIVVVLRDLEGLAYEEIAEALGLELNTVRSRLHRARSDLKAKLERFLP